MDEFVAKKRLKALFLKMNKRTVLFAQFCNKIFDFQKKLNPSDICIHKENKLIKNPQLNINAIQRYIDKSPKTAINAPISSYLIIMDTTFFEREFGV